MAVNEISKYDVDPHIAEVYDGDWATEADEVDDLRRLLAGQGPLRILEPFCGTGRIVLPLAQDGHELIGMDYSEVLLGRLREELAQLPEEVQRRVTLIQGDNTVLPWPTGFDVAFLGGNCLWELATAEEQSHTIASAAAALKLGGHAYIDNDLVTDELTDFWREPGLHWRPSFACADGTLLEFGRETVSYDVPRQVHRDRRIVRVTSPGGQVKQIESISQRHPTSLADMRGWLSLHGFVTEQATESDTRATYWARRGR